MVACTGLYMFVAESESNYMYVYTTVTSKTPAGAVGVNLIFLRSRNMHWLTHVHNDRRNDSKDKRLPDEHIYTRNH